MLIIFTGNGKGKTTAAIGQAIRALGQGKRVLIIQFIKGSYGTGEEKFFKRLKVKGLKFKFIPAGKGFVKILGDKLPFSEHKKAAQKGLKLARMAIKTQKWDLIIFDEINVAVNLKLIKSSDVLKILKPIRVDRCRNLRKSVREADVILTGRHAPKSFLKIADLATDMKEIRHPFQKNKASMKKGIEY